MYSLPLDPLCPDGHRGLLDVPLALYQLQLHVPRRGLLLVPLGPRPGVLQRPLEDGLHGADGVLERLDEVVARPRQPRRREGREEVARAHESRGELGDVDSDGLIRPGLGAVKESNTC